MLIAALLILAAYLMAHSGDVGTAVIFGVFALVVWLGLARFVRLVAGIAMMLRAFSG